ncbi:MAG: hypothetical protein H6733_15890 [Alphaproteobacteria bacterium]|nr:hypothetical protein [Alphaproteobacteria bacterium]
MRGTRIGWVLGCAALVACAGTKDAGTDDTDTDTDTVETDTVDTDTVDTDADTDTVDTDTDITDPCVWTATSDLTGVSLSGGAVSCTWSLDDAEDGIRVPFTLAVEAVHDVIVQTVPCGPFDASGLKLVTYLSATPNGSSDDTWCAECDLGPCPANTTVSTTVTGTYPETVTLRPHQWRGPSDFGAVPGSRFPAGAYTIVVEAQGVLTAEATPWHVRLEAPLTLTP